MAFMRYLGGRAQPAQMPIETETEAVRQIVARLDALPGDQARLLAGMAYVLARAANSDMRISDAESAAIEEELVGAGLDRSQAVLVTEMAKLQELTSGGTSDFLVTRDFREIATPDQKLAVLRGCYHVAAAEEGISSLETATLDQIADELDIDRTEVNRIRAEFADSITARLDYRPPDAPASADMSGQGPQQPGGTDPYNWKPD
jgi:uncharacterized tellurite resistance protein B-like protein